MTVATTLFRFEDSYAREVPGLSVPWTAASAPAPGLLVLNEELGADPAALREPPGVALLAGQAPDGVTTVAQARQADARRRILEAARVVVAEQGFAAAQVAVVASVADVAVLDEIRPAAAGHPLLADT